MKLPIQTPYVTGATPISFEQAALFLSPEEIAAGEQRAKIKTQGPWSALCSFRALAIAHPFDVPNPVLTVYGERALSSPKESGYQLEGKVSVDGKIHRGFTSSMLFELPNGKLVDCAIIHVCADAPQPA